MGNVTAVTEFVLVGFPNRQEVEIIFFVVFLLAYLVTVLGNALIVILVYTDCHLHTPMYYFLSNLSFIEISMTSSVVPKMLANFLSEKKTISFAGCFSQFYFYFSLAATEFILFAVMSYDRYVAICNPLRYPMIMTERVCGQLFLGAWVGGMVLILPLADLKAKLPYCGPNIIDHYFCDSAPLLHLACTDIWVAELRDFMVSVLLLLSSLAVTVFSYNWIILTIVRIPSAHSRQETFATCASHFTVVSLGFGISIFIYVRPSQMDPGRLNKILFVLSSIVTPLLNPFIFSLRNQQMKEAWKNALHNCLGMAEEARKPRESSWLVGSQSPTNLNKISAFMVSSVRMHPVMANVEE